MDYFNFLSFKSVQDVIMQFLKCGVSFSAHQ